MLIGVALFCCGKYRTNNKNKNITITNDSDINKETMFDKKEER